MTARMIQRGLHTARSCLLARAPRRANPGLGYQLEQLQEHPEKSSEASEDYADLESDFMDVQKTHRQYEREQQQHRDRIRQFMIKHKYFRDAKLPNLLLHAEKEQMRLLHERDPEEWSVERLAESFPATPDIVQKILRAKWRPRSVQRIRSHDETVIKNWQLLGTGKGDFSIPPKRANRGSAIGGKKKRKRSEERAANADNKNIITNEKKRTLPFAGCK